MPILHNVTIEEYHAQIARCSHSRFRDFVTKGARYYFERYIAKTILHEPSDAMLLGTAFETLFQEGDAAFEQLIFHQRVDGRGIKDQLAAARGAGKLIVKDDDYQRLQTMRASLMDCQDGMELIEGADRQATITGDAYGLPMQSRPDWLSLEGLAITDYQPYTVDLKTTANLDDLRGDSNKLYMLGYHTQASLARELLRANGYAQSQHFLLAVEKQGACRSALIRLSPQLLDWAGGYYAKYAPGLIHCIHTNTWPRAEPTCEVGLPRWVSQPDNQNLPVEETSAEEMAE